MSEIWLICQESEKDATKHKTKAEVEISQYKTTNLQYNWIFLGQRQKVFKIKSFLPQSRDIAICFTMDPFQLNIDTHL